MGLEFKKDEIIDRRYKIAEKLVEGGMSVVYRAVDLTTDSPVAVKFLKEGLTSSFVEDVIRFKREIEIVSRFEHPSIIKLYNSGEYGHTPYIVNELLEGDNLLDLLKNGRTFSAHQTVDIIRQLAAALSYVHGKGIIHRDLKPGNVFMEKQDPPYRVKLLDFGVSLIMELGEIRGEEAIVGTFGYMSPEATGVINRKIDERSDLYSLGVIFYRLLAGELPFKSTDLSKLLHQQVALVPSRPGQVRKNLPAVLDEIVMKLIEKEPELRYQSARGLAHDLERYLAGETDFIIGEKDQKIKLTYQTRLIGREEELKKIKSLYERARMMEGSVCLISGEAGVGKSRLVEEIQGYVYEQGGWFIPARCIDQENKVPYQIFRDAVNGIINRMEKLEAPEKEREVLRVKSVLGGLDEIVMKLNPRIREILGPARELVALDGERENQRFLSVAARFFCHLADDDRVGLLFLDDLQWADEGSLILLEEIAKEIGRSNLFILATVRSEEVKEGDRLFRFRAGARARGYGLEEIELAGFDRKGLNRVVAGLLGEKEEKSEKISDYVFEKTGGNPFFTITIIRDLVEEKGLVWQNGSWTEDWERIRRIHISANMIDMILKRSENLSADENELISLGAVIGGRFDIRLLFRVLAWDKEKIIRLVDEIIGKQLIEESMEKGRILFVHDRIREAFYQKLDRDKKTGLHSRVAQALEDLYAEKREEVLFDLVHHYVEATDTKKTLQYVFPAARKARDGYANEEAIKYYQLGLFLLEQTGGKGNAEWIRAQEEMIEACLTIGQSDRAIAVSMELLPLRKTALEKAQTYRRMGLASFKKGLYPESEKYYDQALRLLGKRLPMTVFAIILSMLKELFIHSLHTVFPALFSRREGKQVSVRDRELNHIYHSLSWLYILSDTFKFINNSIHTLNFGQSRMGLSKELGLSISTYASFLSAVPLFRGAGRYHQAGLELREKLADEWGIAQSLQFMGFNLNWMGKLEKSMEVFEKSREKFQRIGDMWELGMVVNGLGFCHYYQSRYDRAIYYFTEYLNISEKIKDDNGVASAMENLGYQYLELGNYAKAEELGKNALAIAERMNIALEICDSSYELGYLELERKNYREAIKYLEKAREVDRSNQLLKHYTVNIYHSLTEARIGEFKSRAGMLSGKDFRKEIKKIEAASREALKQSASWPVHFGGALRARAMVYALIHKNRLAERYFLAGLRHTEKMGRKYETGKTHYEYGMFLENINRRGDAKTQWENAYAVFKEIGAASFMKRCAGLTGEKEERKEETERISPQERLSIAREMEAVLNTSQSLSSILDLDELLEKIMDSTTELVGAERGILLLYPDSPERARKLEVKVMRNVKEGDSIKISRSITARVEQERKSLIIDDATLDGSLRRQESIVRTGLKSVLCAPVIVKGEMLGMIYLDNHLVSGLFSERDRKILDMIASQAGVSIQNARLHKKAIESELFEKDLKIASDIQKFFLPRSIEDISKVSINTYYSPAKFVGGDYYDIVRMDDTRFGIIIMDVSGHGSSAAIVMSVISFLFHSEIGRVNHSAGLMTLLNAKLYERLKGEKYATGIFLIYDTEKETFEYTNAGHSDILLYKPEQGRLVSQGAERSAPIGIDGSTSYRQDHFPFRKGDLLVLATDGVYEARDAGGNLFGYERLSQLVLENRDLDVERINQSIVRQVDRFTGHAPPGDDMTLIAVRKTG